MHMTPHTISIVVLVVFLLTILIAVGAAAILDNRKPEPIPPRDDFRDPL